MEAEVMEAVILVVAAEVMATQESAEVLEAEMAAVTLVVAEDMEAVEVE